MKLFRVVVLLLAGALLVGCVKNEAEFEQFRVALRKRPDIQAKGVAKCESRIKYLGSEGRRYLAGYAHIPADDKVPQTVCRRFLKGYLSGRMKWADYEALTRGNRQRFTPNLVAIIRAG